MVAVSVGQTVIVPFDVISQHMMVLGLAARQVGGAAPSREPVAANPLAVATEGRSKWQVTWDIARTIYTRDGLRGFYRGYVASLCTYVPSSACWWTFYSSYQVLSSSRLDAALLLDETVNSSIPSVRCSALRWPRPGPRTPCCSVWPRSCQVRIIQTFSSGINGVTILTQI